MVTRARELKPKGPVDQVCRKGVQGCRVWSLGSRVEGLDFRV